MNSKKKEEVESPVKAGLKTKEEIVLNWLPRYTGRPLDEFGEYILLTNFSGYLKLFSEWNDNAPIYGLDKPMQSVTANGITIINFGTALPEIVTTITAARRKESELLVGSLVGSNIFNICIVLGLPVAIFGGITLASFSAVDLMMPIISSAVLWWVSRRGSHGEDGRILRSEGVILLIVFLAYYSYVIYGALV